MSNPPKSTIFGYSSRLSWQLSVTSASCFFATTKAVSFAFVYNVATIVQYCFVLAAYLLSVIAFRDIHFFGNCVIVLFVQQNWQFFEHFAHCTKKLNHLEACHSCPKTTHFRHMPYTWQNKSVLFSWQSWALHLRNGMPLPNWLVAHYSIAIKHGSTIRVALKASAAPATTFSSSSAFSCVQQRDQCLARYPWYGGVTKTSLDQNFTEIGTKFLSKMWDWFQGPQYDFGLKDIICPSATKKKFQVYG